MDSAVHQLIQTATPNGLVRAFAILDGDCLSVILDDGWVMEALILSTGGPLKLENGADVLVLLPSSHSEPAIVLGCVTNYASAANPKTLSLGASESVTLTSGDASVTLRSDKVLVKGKEVVSRAKRANQIKGGSVSIN
ncbi:MAG: hypothetical protein AB8G17_18995 [Gammaproteobacteria bacterium]